MKIRRSMVALFILSTFLIPISLYRAMYSAGASEEFLSTVSIIQNVLMAVFLALVFSFSLFTDDYPRSYTPRVSRLLGFTSMLLAAAIGYTSALGIISEEYSPFRGVSGTVFAVLGVLSVLTFMFYSVTYLKGQNIIPSVAIAPLFPSLWYGFRMLLCFLKSASMADIRDELPMIAMCCAFTIFSLTLGKLLYGISSNSIKWGFAAGCVGIVTAMMYTFVWVVKDCDSPDDLLSHPLIIVDLLMALFAIGSLFHVSAPAEYFDDEQWDDYFYENYDLPKPNLILHTPVDELEEDNMLDDETPYIPSGTGVGGSAYTGSTGQNPPGVPAQIPSYIANPAAYYPQYPAYPAAPVPPAPQYYPPAYPVYPPVYPTYPYPAAPPAGFDYYGQPAAYDPYDTAAAQYQYDRRRAELQSRELEKLTGEVDDSLARLGSNVAQNRPPMNEFVTASPDESIGGGQQQPSGVNVQLNGGYIRSGERLTDHLDRIGQERRDAAMDRNGYPGDGGDEEYTYEYYYPSDGSRYDLGQFK